MPPDHGDVLEDPLPEEPSQSHTRLPQIGARVPPSTKQVTVGQAAALLGHDDTVPGLSQAQGSHRPTEAAADHDDICVPCLIHLLTVEVW